MKERRVVSIALMACAAASYGVVTPLVKLAAVHRVSIRLLTVYQYPLALTLFLTAVIASRSFQSLGKRDWILLLAIVLGTLMAAGASGMHRLSWDGLGLGLVAACGYALTLFWQSQTSSTGSPWQRSLVSAAVATAIVMAVYRPWSVMQTPIPTDLTIGLGSAAGLFALALPLVFVYYSAPTLGGVLTAILASLELPIAVFLSAVWLGEPVGWLQWLGVVLILGAIAWSGASHARQTPSR
jgi:drug/metabolite transporter (DMT)-like permease